MESAMEFQFEIDNTTETEINPDLAFVFDYLKQMDGKFNTYCTLSSDDESYVQCAGDKKNLIIEFRKYNSSKYRHFVIGCKNKKTNDSSIKYSGGIIKLKKNEILNGKDAILIFESFFEKNEIPDEYVLREITDMF